MSFSKDTVASFRAISLSSSSSSRRSSSDKRSSSKKLSSLRKIDVPLTSLKKTKLPIIVILDIYK